MSWINHWTHFLNERGTYDRRWWFRVYVGLTRGWHLYAYNGHDRKAK